MVSNQNGQEFEFFHYFIVHEKIDLKKRVVS